MNKEKAIKEIKKESEIFYACDYIKTKVAESIISKINEPQKVTVPKFVGEWIEWCKTNEATLLGAISPIDEFGLAICNDKRVESMATSRWAQRNQDTFARAWLDGYEVEKSYVVTDGNKLYLKEFDELNAVIIIDDVVGATDYAKRYSDKAEAQKVADELGWFVKEVE